jgi:hypothetical protein
MNIFNGIINMILIIIVFIIIYICLITFSYYFTIWLFLLLFKKSNLLLFTYLFIVNKLKYLFQINLFITIYSLSN